MPLPMLNSTTAKQLGKPAGNNLQIRIIQFGEGNFLRAFADWMVWEMNRKSDFGAGILVVQPIAQGLAGLMNRQDGLYTLFLRGIQDSRPQSSHFLIDCVTKAIDPYTHYASYLDSATWPGIRFVFSNTTEAGIAVNPSDSPADSPPKTFPAKLTAWLWARYRHFSGDPAKGLVVIPCELIDNNGTALKAAVLQYAALWGLESGFIEWVTLHNTFCGTLVDRIVPGFPKDRASEIWAGLGYEDQLLVEAEQFHFWAIEAPDWVANEFPAHKAGLNVIFTQDLAPYKKRKVRILNGAHTALVPVAFLCGLDTVREAVENPACGAFLNGFVFEEAVPALDMPASELLPFAASVLDRFRNPYIKHYLSSIALNSWPKFETRLLPTLLDFHRKTGSLPQRTVFSLAALILYYNGDRDGQPFTLQDDSGILAFFKEAWAEHRKTADTNGLVAKVLGHDPLWKQDLNQVPGLANAATAHLRLMIEKGMRAALATAFPQ